MDSEIFNMVAEIQFHTAPVDCVGIPDPVYLLCSKTAASFYELAKHETTNKLEAMIMWTTCTKTNCQLKPT